MAMTLGGRAAEEIVFGEITTGASDDLDRVTSMAQRMVTRFGMSRHLGPRVFGHDRGQPFLGRELRATADYSAATAAEIDDEISRVVQEAYRRAKGILRDRRDALTRISETLLERETIDRDEFTTLLEPTTGVDVFADAQPSSVAQSA
jgi:cell division protease FtsH